MPAADALVQPLVRLSSTESIQQLLASFQFAIPRAQDKQMILDCDRRILHDYRTYGTFFVAPTRSSADYN